MPFKRRNQPRSAAISGDGLRSVGLLALVLLAALALPTSDALAAQPSVGLGTVDSFAVLAGSTVTNTGPSTINGDLGVSPGTALTGFAGAPGGTVNGTIHAGDAVAGQAQADLTSAYNDAAGRTPPVLLASAELGGQALTAGVYKSATLRLTGALTLDAQGDPNAVFIFQADSTLITAAGSQVNLVNGAQPCNVFWQIGSSAMLGTSSVFTGNILALASISVNDGVTLAGRALARSGAVTLINDTITAAHCATGGTGGTGGTGAGTPPVAPPTGVPPGNGTPGGHDGTAGFLTPPGSAARTVKRFGTARYVPRKFRVVVSGHLIRRVVFRLDGQVISRRGQAPFWAPVAASGGVHTLTVRITFTDRTPAVTLRLRFRSHAAPRRPVAKHHPASQSQPPLRSGGFTG